MQETFTMNHLEFILEQRAVWMNWKTEIPLLYQMILQMKQEHFFFFRTTEYLP